MPRARVAARLALVLLALALVGLEGACGRAAPERTAPDDSADRPPGAPRFGRGTVIIDRGSDTVLVDVEVAQTPQQRRYGLMGRRSLPPDRGMVFVYFRRHRGAFWMKDTLIPLSIAFFGRDGRIEAILDMKPCRRQPCRLYDPGVPYWGALEVNLGAFDRWRVESGDSLHLAQ